jgi:hypothetical protein
MDTKESKHGDSGSQHFSPPLGFEAGLHRSGLHPCSHPMSAPERGDSLKGPLSQATVGPFTIHTHVNINVTAHPFPDCFPKAVPGSRDERIPSGHNPAQSVARSPPPPSNLPESSGLSPASFR